MINLKCQLSLNIKLLPFLILLFKEKVFSYFICYCPFFKNNIPVKLSLVMCDLLSYQTNTTWLLTPFLKLLVSHTNFKKIEMKTLLWFSLKISHGKILDHWSMCCTWITLFISLISLSPQFPCVILLLTTFIHPWVMSAHTQ